MKTINTISESMKIDWEVPGATFDEAAEDYWEEQLDTLVQLIEEHNGVKLEDEALRNFRNIAPIFYGD